MRYIYNMKSIKQEHVTIKIWRSTLSKLRLLAGMREKAMVKILDELIIKELKDDKKINWRHNGKCRT